MESNGPEAEQNRTNRNSTLVLKTASIRCLIVPMKRRNQTKEQKEQELHAVSKGPIGISPLSQSRPSNANKTNIWRTEG